MLSQMCGWLDDHACHWGQSSYELNPIEPQISTDPNGCCVLNALPSPKCASQFPSMPSPNHSHQGQLINRLQLVEEIGQGAFGTVHRATEAGTGDEFAVKVIDLSHTRVAKREIAILNALAKHQATLSNVAGCLDTLQKAQSFWICMPLIEGKNLFDVIFARSQHLKPKEVKKIAHGIATGVHQLHAHGIVHRDIKPENIMLEKDATPKIIDFGLSTFVPDVNGKMFTICGTPSYAAPELILSNHRGYTMACDDWSLGVVFHTLLTASLPFPQPNIKKLRQAIERYQASSDSTDQISRLNAIKNPKAKQLIHALLRTEEMNRLKSFNHLALNEIVQHDWFSA